MSRTYSAHIEIHRVSGQWQTLEEQISEYDGTACAYGRELLADHLSRNPEQMGMSRVRVWEIYDISTDPPTPSGVTALIDDPAPVPAEVAAVEAGQEEVVRCRHTLESSIQQLDKALREAREAGHRANRLAEIALPALTRNHP